MLTENKFSKYVLYALGEIVLVVIGILIALSINNWNEEHKKNKEEIKVLLNLKNEFIQNQKELKKDLESHKFINQQISELSTLMNPNPKEIESKKLDTLMFAMVYMPEFSALTSIMSSEKFKLVNDEKLKNEIAYWELIYNEYKYDVKLTYDLYYDHIYPFLSKNYQMKNIKGEVVKSDESYFEINSSSILSNSTFENHVKMRSLNAGGVFKNATKLFETQKRIIENIEFKLSNDDLPR